MMRLIFTLILTTIGGTVLLHYLKNFLLKEKVNFYWDWDGLLERLLITYIIITLPEQWLLIPLIIAIKAVYRIFLLGLIPNIIGSGIASQKVWLKAELAFDLLLSPAWAILLGVLFR